jgi:hypothetical protein
MGNANVGATGNAAILQNGKMTVSNFSDTNMNGTYTKDSGGTTPGGNNPSGDGGTFTLTGIPSQYNGKWAALEGGNNSSFLLGCQSINMSTGVMTFVPISGGTVSIPMWLMSGSENNPTFTRYSGNQTVEVYVAIKNLASEIFTGDNEYNIIAGVTFNSVTFSNGSATKVWSQGSEGIQ